MRFLHLAAAALLGASSLSPSVAQPAPVAGADAPAPVAIREDGLVATWYPPANGRRGPAVIALGGSEGGERGGQMLARALSREGYGVLALAYFGADGLPPELQEVPLEYFDRAIAWVRRQPLVDPARVGIYGISIGGETALVVAARHPELRAVVAAVPSSVVWQGFSRRDYRSVRSTYSVGGQPAPYVPYDTSAPFTGVFDLYQRSMASFPAHQDAVIPVERIGGAVLLLSARSDALWPSTAMSEQVMARLDAHHFARPHRHIAYPDAGHGAMSPPDGRPAGDPARSALDNLGGTAAGNAAARTGMWQEVKAFLAAQLGRPGR